MRKAQLSFGFKGPGDKASDTPVFYFSSFFLSLVFKSPGDTASDNIPVLFMGFFFLLLLWSYALESKSESKLLIRVRVSPEDESSETPVLYSFILAVFVLCLSLALKGQGGLLVFLFFISFLLMLSFVLKGPWD